MKTYIFHVELLEEDDGRWSAGVPSLRGFATWGYTKEEALANIQDAVEAYIQDMQKSGEEIPEEAAVQVVQERAVAVTV